MLSLRNLFPANKKAVGLDIGSSNIKLVDLQDTANGCVLKSFAQVPMERGVIEGGLIKDHNALVSKITEAFDESHCMAGNVVTALPGRAVMINKATFRKMEDEELREFIIDEAREYMPFDDIGDVNFDFHICNNRESDSDQIDVIIAAAKKSVIESYAYAIAKAGRKVTIIDVDSFALETAYDENYDFDVTDTIALVNIGASITNINIINNDESVFTRNILLGGNSISETLQTNLGVSFDEAERIKTGDMEKQDRIPGKLVDYLEPIFLEIGRTFDFFSSTANEPQINRILVSGGCAGIQGVVDSMKQKFYCEAEIFNPFKNISCNRNVFSPSYITDIGFAAAAVAIGLALRGIESR
ncbi:MAG: type IV pilus assembly protein PilM [Thermodesulfobacteriota bacterium]|nr:type IV pilus assembly protein PilM [Thermodesulfobacteriota bacterium]